MSRFDEIERRIKAGWYDQIAYSHAVPQGGERLRRLCSHDFLVSLRKKMKEMDTDLRSWIIWDWLFCLSIFSIKMEAVIRGGILFCGWTK